MGGIPGTPGAEAPYTTIIDDAGNIYIGGNFIVAGNVIANRVAKWDGSTWSALGSGISGGNAPFVIALAMSGTNLYVGGSFNSAGGVPATNIAKWNGSTWSPVGSGIGNTVFALAVLGADVY